MTHLPKIFIINGSASNNSSNQKLIDNFVALTEDYFNVTVFNELKNLPHFNPELSLSDTPKIVEDFRHSIENADAVLICTPRICFQYTKRTQKCY